MILMLLVAVFFAWLGYHMRRTADERAAIAWLEARGAEIGYRVEHRTRWTFFGHWIPEPVRTVRLDGATSPLAIDDLSQLAVLDELWFLRIENGQVEDLSPLADLRELQQLEITGAPVQDLAPLSEIEGLRILMVSGCETGDVDSLAKLQELAILDLGSTPVADPTPLTGLPKLKSLRLSSTHLTDLMPLAELPVTCSLHLEGPHNTALLRNDFRQLKEARPGSFQSFNPTPGWGLPTPPTGPTPAATPAQSPE